MSMPDGESFATVERPWLNNAKNVSCIPEGVYVCGHRKYHAGGYDAIEVKNVPDRTYIMCHIGNYVRNSNGCILINREHGATGSGEWCGVNSTKAFNRFMSLLKGKDSLSLRIKSVRGGVLS